MAHRSSWWMPRAATWNGLAHRKARYHTSCLKPKRASCSLTPGAAEHLVPPDLARRQLCCVAAGLPLGAGMMATTRPGFMNGHPSLFDALVLLMHLSGPRRW